jgi:integrating conjugative element protein (TIGR03758 family)
MSVAEGRDVGVNRHLCPKAWRTALVTLAVMSGIVLAAGNYADYLGQLARVESGNNAGARNDFGYLGLYQMGEQALAEAGYYRPDGTAKNDWRGSWTGKDGVRNTADFLSRPSVQTQAVTAYSAAQWSQIKNLDLDGYLGQTVGGVLITPSGLLAGAHLVGVGGLRRFLSSGGTGSVRDGNGTSIATYLSALGGFDVSAVMGVSGAPSAGSATPAPGATIGITSSPHPPLSPSAAFATGAGIGLGAVKALVLQTLAVGLLLWTAWVSLMQYIGWRRERLSLMQVQTHIVKATVLTMLVLFVTLA